MTQKVKIADIVEYQTLEWKRRNIGAVLLRGFLVKAKTAGFEFRSETELLNFLQNYPAITEKIQNQELRKELDTLTKGYRANLNRFKTNELRTLNFVQPNEKSAPVIEFRIDNTMILNPQNN